MSNFNDNREFDPEDIHGTRTLRNDADEREVGFDDDDRRAR